MKDQGPHIELLRVILDQRYVCKVNECRLFTVRENFMLDCVDVIMKCTDDVTTLLKNCRKANAVAQVLKRPKHELFGFIFGYFFHLALSNNLSVSINLR